MCDLPCVQVEKNRKSSASTSANGTKVHCRVVASICNGSWKIDFGTPMAEHVSTNTCCSILLAGGWPGEIRRDQNLASWNFLGSVASPNLLKTMSPTDTGFSTPPWRHTPLELLRLLLQAESIWGCFWSSCNPAPVDLAHGLFQE